MVEVVEDIPCANLRQRKRLFEFLLQEEQKKNPNNGKALKKSDQWGLEW